MDRPPDESFSRGSSRGAGRGDDSAGAKSFGDRSTARDEKAARAEAKAAAAADEDRGANIIKRHLFGVPPPDDRRIFDDMSACFEYFRDRSELKASIEENKQILKDKMLEAQLLGERANQSRNTINYLKNSIEAIRRERALSGIGLTEGKEEDEGKAEETPEEQAHRRAIEHEKTVYRESFEKLRVLKPEIEYLRKILEKGRATLQNQFDSWYNNLQSRGGVIGGGGGGNAPTIAPVKVSTASFEEPFQVKRQSAVPLKPQQQPPADDVNEDIAAFYKAKDAMLKMRGEQAK